MAYLYILLMFILLPIRLVISFITQFFWFPNFKTNKKLQFYKPTDIVYSYFAGKASCELDMIANDGDGPKFISLYHFASRIDPDHIDPTDHMYKFYHQDKTFMRYELLEDNFDVPTASGDMMAGFVFARTADVLYGFNTKAAEYVQIIKNVVHNKIPFAVSHPLGEFWGRGFIWPIWGDGGDVIKCVAMIDSAIETGKKIGQKNVQLQIIKWLIIVTNLPLIVWSYDSAFHVGNAYLTKWFGPHSKMMYLTSGYLLTKHWFYKRSLTKMYKKYGHIVPDIAFMYKFACPNEKVDLSFANYLVADYIINGKGTQQYKGPKVIATNVEKLIKYPFDKKPYKSEMSAVVLEPRYRYETNVWERDPLKFQTGPQNGKRANCLDIIFALAVLNNIKK